MTKKTLGIVFNILLILIICNQSFVFHKVYISYTDLYNHDFNSVDANLYFIKAIGHIFELVFFTFAIVYFFRLLSFRFHIKRYSFIVSIINVTTFIATVYTLKITVGMGLAVVFILKNIGERDYKIVFTEGFMIIIMTFAIQMVIALKDKLKPVVNLEAGNVGVQGADRE